MMMEFGIEAFSAWAPGIETEEAWRSWAVDSAPVCADEKPKCKQVPPMIRRRLTQWGRMALEVATACSDSIDQNTPTIFVSRHGDTRRTASLLESIAQEEMLSPTAFSLSVHNSSSGIFSMVRQVFGPALAVASGKDSLAQAFIEAHGLLSDGHDRVLLVMVDEPLAEFYLPDTDEQDMPYAFALVLNKGGKNTLSVGYEAAASKATDESGLSLGVQFLSFWYAEKIEMAYNGKRLSWRFSRS